MIYLTQRLDHAHPITASVTLPIDVRVKSRARVALNDGREAGLMLPRGLLLRGGDLLTTDDGSEVIEVIAAAESVSVVRCADPFLLARAGEHQQVIEPGQGMEKTGLEAVGTVAWMGERRNGKGQQ